MLWKNRPRLSRLRTTKNKKDRADTHEGIHEGSNS